MDDKKIFLDLVRSSDQMTDVFTKALRRIKFEVFRSLMGLKINGEGGFKFDSHKTITILNFFWAYKYAHLCIR